MKSTLTLLVFLYATQTFAQNDNDEYQAFVFESNLPSELLDFYTQDTIKSKYSIRTNLNPFYLRGDFDGDHIQDYAVSIIEKKSGKMGILIYHSGTKFNFIIGAGNSQSIGNGGDDYNWMDAWNVVPKGDIEKGVGESEKITLIGEAISAIKLESASGLIYWNGKEYKWYQQGD